MPPVGRYVFHAGDAACPPNRKVFTMMHLEREEMLNTLVERINDFVDGVSSHVVDGLDCRFSEYLENYRYGQLDIRQAIKESRLPDEVKASILKHKTADAIKEHIEPYLSINVIGIYIDDTEIDSLTVGELEEPLPEHLTEQWKALSPEEKTYVSQRVNAYFPDDEDGQFIYIDHNYDRYVLLFDVENYELDYPTEPEDRTDVIRTALGKIDMLSRELKALKNESPFIEADAARKPELKCIEGAGLEAVDLMHYRIAKKLISKKSSAKLKLVG